MLLLIVAIKRREDVRNKRVALPHTLTRIFSCKAMANIHTSSHRRLDTTACYAISVIKRFMIINCWHS